MQGINDHFCKELEITTRSQGGILGIKCLIQSIGNKNDKSERVCQNWRKFGVVDHGLSDPWKDAAMETESNSS